MDTDTLDGYFETLTNKIEILKGAKTYNNKIIESKGTRHFSPYAFRKAVITALECTGRFSEAQIDSFNGHALKGVNGKNYTYFNYETQLKPVFLEHYVNDREVKLREMLVEAGIFEK